LRGSVAINPSPFSLASLAACGPPGGDHHERFFLRAIAKARIVQLQVLAAIVGRLARQQALDDVDGFDEPLVPLGDAGPSFAYDVLVETFAGAQT
jgi:hypothetical protein